MKKLMQYKFRVRFLFYLLIIGLFPFQTFAKIKVAASLPDFASIASYIGGNEVEVFSIAKSNANPHFVEVIPSYMIKVSRVSLFLKVGMDLDQWADAIIEGSRNNKLDIVDCSVGISVLEKPVGKVDASMGDVHPQGNPHYWLNPENGVIIAEHICAALSKLDPGHADLFKANTQKFKTEVTSKMVLWKSKMSPWNGAAILTYHSSWVYFAKAFGLRIIGFVEPFPGIPPSAKHLQFLVNQIKTEKISVLSQEAYFSDSDSKFLARQTGIKTFRLMPSCDGTADRDYFQHFENIVAQFSQEAPKP